MLKTDQINRMFGQVNYDEVHSLIISFISKKVGSKSVVIGLSGGIDSSITCSLAVDALGNNKVKVLIIKNIRYSDENLSIARNFANREGVEIIEIDSNEIRNQFLSRIELQENDVRQTSSLDARITDLLIRTVSSKEERIYLGTINGTERLTGWYPKGALFGDVCPIAGLLKRQVQELARFKKLPEGIIESVSEDASKVCSGCGELPEFKGIPYDVLDAVLYVWETEKTIDFYKKIDGLGISRNHVRIILDRIESVNNKQEIFSPYPRINF